MQKKMTWLWILLGIGNKLQIVASLSVLELIVLLAAPFIFVANYRQLKHDGVMGLFVMSLLVIIGCLIASITNHTPLFSVIRGLAVTCIISCAIVFSHWILRKDPGGFKWFLLFSAFSMILSTFILKQAVEVEISGESAEEIMTGPIFWIKRLGGLLIAPISGWYLKVPFIYSVGTPLFMVGFSLLASVSGRGAAMRYLAFSLMVILGGRTRRTISRISRNFYMLGIVGLIGAILSYSGYKYVASRGLLGEDARRKYESQTEGGYGGLFRLIVSGRGASFIGLLACRDKPITGWGPWALDKGRYVEEFMVKYGTYDDLMYLYAMDDWRQRNGITERLLPCHSYITQFWLWYGIWGLLFWIYVVFIAVRYLKQDAFAVPQWYAWLACGCVPGLLWGVIFSPLSDRVPSMVFIVACLMARAVRKGTFRLPYDMEQENEQMGSKR